MIIIRAMLGAAQGTTEGQKGSTEPNLKRNWKMQGNGFSPSISSRTHSCGHFHFSLVRPDRTSDLQPGLQNPGKVLRSGCPECFRTGAAKSKRPRVRKIRHIPIISRGLLTSLDCEGRGEVIGGGWDSIKISL